MGAIYPSFHISLTLKYRFAILIWTMTFLPYIQIILAVLLVAAILMQRSEASTGGIFGGNDNWNAAYHTRRGFEKTLFNITIILGVLFTVASVLALILR